MLVTAPPHPPAPAIVAFAAPQASRSASAPSSTSRPATPRLADVPNPASRPAAPREYPEFPRGSKLRVLWAYEGRGNVTKSPPTHDGFPGEHLGISLTSLGDLDHDGVSEFGIGAMTAGYVFWYGPGVVRMYSGRTGTMLHELRGSEEPQINNGRWDGYDAFGDTIGNAGDVDADGTEDLIALAPRAGDWKGFAEVFSGSSAGSLLVLHGARRTWTGGRAGCAGDLDEDGHDDPYAEIGGLDVFSGRTGARIASGSSSGTGLLPFALPLPSVGDLDGDGAMERLDVAYRRDGRRKAGTGVARVEVVSGTGRRVLRTLLIPEPERWYFRKAGVAGDLDGDGWSELWVTLCADSQDRLVAQVPDEPRSELLVLSLRDGREIARLESKTSYFFGSRVCRAGDLNGDGREELLIANHESNEPGKCAGVVYVVTWAL